MTIAVGIRTVAVQMKYPQGNNAVLTLAANESAGNPFPSKTPTKL